MITQERVKAMEEDFLDESNDPKSIKWREDLTAEESALVAEWDRKVYTGLRSFCGYILGLNEDQKSTGKPAVRQPEEPDYEPEL